MRYLSVCSGIEAASVAWTPLGWEAVAFAEIEAFPSAVLKNHYPDVPNWGDLTKFKDWPDAAFDVLVGGTPCQSFSVAGLRKGLDDPRGNLALTYLAVLDKYRPTWCLWENVPGVLSSGGGRDFGAFLGGLGQLGYGFAYRVLDAQYFGVAQRRRRVFVVGCLGGWQRAAAVLFDGESLCGHPAPRRETGQRLAPSVTSGPPFSRTGNDRVEAEAMIPSVSLCLNAGAMGRIDGESETMIPVAHALRADGFDASEDGTGRGTPLVPTTIAGPLVSHRRGVPSSDECAGNHIVAFSVKDHGADAGDIAPTLRSGGHDKSHANGGVMPAVAFNWQQGGATALGMGLEGVPPVRAEQTLAMLQGMAVRRLTPRECERLQGFPDDYTLVPYRGKPAADGNRYKALGNSMAVPVMAWIGRRLQIVAEIMRKERAA